MVKTNRNPVIYILVWVAMLLVDALMIILKVVSGVGNITGMVVSGSFTVICMLILAAAAVYHFWYFWTFCQDMNTICQRKENDATQISPNWLVVCFLSIVTLGIYQLYWVYKQCNRLQFCGKSYGREIKESGSIMLVFYLLGSITLGITTMVAIYKWSLNMNDMAEAYNEEVRQEKAAPVHKTAPATADDVKTIPQSSDTVIEAGKSGGVILGVKGAYAGAEIAIPDGEELIIGRDRKSASIIVNDEKISRRHCGIRYNRNTHQYQVMDYSRNGIFYTSGQEFSKNIMTICTPGTVIRIGRTDNEFRLN